MVDDIKIMEVKEKEGESFESTRVRVGLLDEHLLYFQFSLIELDRNSKVVVVKSTVVSTFLARSKEC